ncbi:MAG: pSer/pThr/pTyr-binding forkhead associated (FHA) protein [Myxococcota bacterium]|jgi:pSer/pThr/pTyr-binding forkhead associated (FHA) protein
MPEAFLKVISGARQGLNVPLSATDPLIIGRRRGDLVLDDALVSGTHAQILPRDDGWVIQDLGSTNGTLVDGRLVYEAPLRPGAEIALGNTRMVLFIGLAESPAERGSGQTANPQLEIAWLLDEELVELGGSPDRTRSPADVIDQDLRLPPGVSAVVEVVAGQDVGKVFRFTRGNITIGRHLGEIPLSDLEASRRHAVIELFGREMIFLRDLGSTNGTYHNGQRVDVARLRNGDTVGVGRSVLKLRLTS